MSPQTDRPPQTGKRREPARSLLRLERLRTSLVARLVLMTVVASVALALQTSAVSANQMTVFTCHDPSGAAVGHDGWTTQRTGDLNMTLADTCAGSNQGALVLNLGANGAGYGNGAGVDWVFTAPSWASIASYTIQIADSYAIPSTGGGSGQVFVNASDESDPNYDYRNLGSAGLGATTIARTPPTRVSSIVVNASCDGQDGPCAAGVEVSHVDVSAASLVLDDFSAPIVSAISGGLVGGTTIKGTSEVTFNAADEGPGVYSAWLVVDGRVQPAVLLNSNNGLCQNLGQTSNGTRSFAHPEPCAKSTSSSVSLDTTGLPDGQHTLKLMVDDAAGDATTAYVGTFTTKNAGTGSLGALPGPGAAGSGLSVGVGAPNGSGASEAAQVRLGLKGAITRSFRHRALRMSGRLIDSQGRAIGGAALDVLQQVVGSPALKLVGHAKTLANGTFVAKVPPGPSRTVEVAYRAFSADPSYAAVAKVKESVSAGVQLSVSPDRTGPEGTIMLSGKVAGPIPQQGAIVNLLVHYRGRWEPFRTPRTNRHGRFRVAYHFEGGVGRFPFRAEVPAGQAGFPFGSGSSQVVDVRTN